MFTSVSRYTCKYILVFIRMFLRSEYGSSIPPLSYASFFGYWFSYIAASTAACGVYIYMYLHNRCSVLARCYAFLALAADESLRITFSRLFAPKSQGERAW